MYYPLPASTIYATVRKTIITSLVIECSGLQIEAGADLVEMPAGVMGQGSQAGLLSSDLNPKEMARAYLAFQKGMIHLWLTASNQFSLKDSADLFADMIMAGLQNQK